MINFITILTIGILVLPISLLSQQSNWSVEGSLGGNISFNRMPTIKGNDDGFKNSNVVRGYWDVLAQYKFTKKTSLLFGVNHAGYAYQYSYSHFNKYVNGAGSSTGSTVFVWGFPLGIENNWAKQPSKLSFKTGYGLAYRLNRLGQGFLFGGELEAYNSNNSLVFRSIEQESNPTQNDHLVSLFTYLKIDYKLNNDNFSVFFKVLYNQGLNTHETFLFTVENTFIQENRIELNEFQYKSRASYFSFGIGLNYTFNKLKKNRAIIE